jgi:hypothetical protein
MKLMSTIASSVPVLVMSLAATDVYAWNPPDGPDFDHADPPATPTTLLRKAHGYITQNGISILYNDGYWFAAQWLQQMENQQELLNGVRYADVYQGRQAVNLEICLIGLFCDQLDTFKDWPYAADNHYFNPDTGAGLNPGYLSDAATWGPYVTGLVSMSLEEFLLGISLGTVSLDIIVQPSLASQYPSALTWFETEYGNATSAFLTGGAPSINGRQGTALALFYLGWASHFLQDQTVVHHTFDEVLKNHGEYENAADGLITSPPVANGQKTGIYAEQLPTLACAPGSRVCFPSYAAYASHDPNILNAADNKTYIVDGAISFAQRLQAGLYSAFLTDIGRTPVHMSAVMAVRPLL